jgi:hypothetical protein
LRTHPHNLATRFRLRGRHWGAKPAAAPRRLPAASSTPRIVGAG